MTPPTSHISRALAAWREANLLGLIGRLVELHRRDPQQALVLARYAERHGYEGLAGDVAAWPVVRADGYNPGDPPYEVPCPSCDGSGRWGDDVACGRCEGRGVA